MEVPRVANKDHAPPAVWIEDEKWYWRADVLTSSRVSRTGFRMVARANAPSRKDGDGYLDRRYHRGECVCRWASSPPLETRK